MVEIPPAGSPDAAPYRALISAVLADYHKTRLADSDPAVFILGCPRTRRAFEQFAEFQQENTGG